MAFNPKYTVTAQMLTNLAKIEVIKQQFENQPISPQLLLSLRESAKVATIHYSTQIEGNRLTGKEVVKVLKGRKLPQREKTSRRLRLITRHGMLWKRLLLPIVLLMRS